MFKILYKYLINRIRRYFRVNTGAKIFTVLLFLLVFGLIMLGIYQFIKEGLFFINIDDYFGEAMSYFVYEVYLLAFILLLIISTVISALFGLFKSKHSEWIMSSPKYFIFPRYIFIRSILTSFWPFLIVIIPFIFAINKVLDYSLLSLLLIFISSLWLVLLIVSLTFALTALLAWLAFGVSKYFVFKSVFNNLAISVFLVLIIIVACIWHVHSNMDLVRLFDAENLELSESAAAEISKNFKYYPSHFLASQIYFWQAGEASRAVLSFGLLTLISLVAAFFWWYYSPNILPVWQKLQEGNSALYSQTDFKASKKKTKYKFSNNPISAFFMRESLIFTRNTRNIMWLGFLMFVWLFQAAVNKLLSWNIVKYGLDYSAVPMVVQVLQLLTLIYFISAFVLRFVLPTFSAEKRTSWIIASAPIDMRKIFWAKYLFYSVFFLIIGLSIGYGQTIFINNSLINISSAMLMFIVSILFITALGLFFSAAFPNYETDDPAILSTSASGIALILISLLYGALGAWCVYLTMVNLNNLFIFNFIALSILLLALMLYFGQKKINKISFIKIIN